MQTIYIARKTDGMIAKVELESEREDLWEAIAEDWPEAYDLIEEDMVLPSDAEYAYDEWFSDCGEIFGKGNLAVWLASSRYDMPRNMHNEYLRRHGLPPMTDGEFEDMKRELDAFHAEMEAEE